MYAISPSHLSPAVPSYVSMAESAFPERPGEAECQYYLKTGDCKFGSSCRYHHPREWNQPKTNFMLSPMGLPLRPVSIFTLPCFFFIKPTVYIYI